MPETLLIEDAPKDIVNPVRERAAQNHRFVRDELLSLIESAIRPGQRFLSPSSRHDPSLKSNSSRWIQTPSCCLRSRPDRALMTPVIYGSPAAAALSW